MKNASAMLALTTALSLSSSDTATSAAVQTWVDRHIPGLIDKAKGALAGGCDVTRLFGLAGDVVSAVQELRGIISGQDRAQVAQVVLVIAAQAALPDLVEPWIVPLLKGEGVKALIESAFQKLFGPDKAPLPAVIPLDDDTLGRPATPEDFGPSMRDAPNLKIE